MQQSEVRAALWHESLGRFLEASPHRVASEVLVGWLSRCAEIRELSTLELHTTAALL